MIPAVSTAQFIPQCCWISQHLAGVTCDPAILRDSLASRRSGNADTNKEKTVRQWFVDHDLIESVLYLPENLFYNTPAPGIVLFLNKDKPKTRQRQIFLVNASQVVEKGDPKNFSPSRYIHTSEADLSAGALAKEKTYRPIREIVAELDAIEPEAKETDKALREILKQLGV